MGAKGETMEIGTGQAWARKRVEGNGEVWE